MSGGEREARGRMVSTDVTALFVSVVVDNYIF